MTTAPGLDSLKSSYQLIAGAVTALRAEYHDGCNNHNHLQRVGAQHQLAWLVPLHRALRAFLNNHCPGSRGRYSQGYYSYLEKYEKVVYYIAERVSIEGPGRLQHELHPLVLALAIPVPEKVSESLSVGMTVSSFISATAQRLTSERRAYFEASNRFLDSLTPSQLADLRAMMKSSQSICSSREGVVTFRLKDIQYR